MNCTNDTSIRDRLDRIEKVLETRTVHETVFLNADIVPSPNDWRKIGTPSYRLANVETERINGRPVADYLDTDSRNYQFEADVEDRLNHIERMLEVNPKR